MSRLVIGVGNPDRGDDAAGIAVARRVTGTVTRVVSAQAMDLYEMWEASDEVVIVDAMRSGRMPGTVEHFDVSQVGLPTEAFASTHSFGPAAGIEIARALGHMPASLEVIGIEAGDLTVGVELSDAVATAVKSVAEELSHA